MKLPDFADVLKTGTFSGVEALMPILQEFKFSPKILGYFTGHRWGVPTAFT
jgi:hypothetical protein